MRSLRRHLRVGGLAAIAVVIAGAALSWATLCLGEDGHVAFEVSVAGRCLDDAAGVPAAGASAMLNSCEARSGCGPCTDFRCTSSAWLGRATTSDLPDPGPALVSVTLAPIAAPLAGVASFRLAAVAHLGATATTVLRC
jgi:hypothetical protein